MGTPFNLIVPIFPVRDLDAAEEHYRALGFELARHDDTYAFAQRDEVWIHLAVTPDHDPARGAAAYLYVEDAAALAAEWGDSAPVATDYGHLEGHHLDPDNNLIRFGSAAASG